MLLITLMPICRHVQLKYVLIRVFERWLVQNTTVPLLTVNMLTISTDYSSIFVVKQGR